MNKLLLTFFSVMFAQAATAENTTYLCKMTKTDSHGWIAPEYAFQIDAQNGIAKVADSPEWMDADFKDRGSNGYRLSWNRDARASAGGNLRVRYQANLDPNNNGVKVRMAFVNTGASNKPYGVGNCQVQN